MITSLLVGFRVVGVSAIPFSRVTEILPEDVENIAIDEETGQYLAFYSNGTLAVTFPVSYEDLTSSSERRQAVGSTCVELSLDEIKRLPGWSRIVDYADDKWGKGGRNIVANPKEYPDRPANLCVSSDVVGLKVAGEPVCLTQETITKGHLTGTSGDVAIRVAQGFTSQSSFTVTRAATVGLSSTVGVTVGIEEIADVTTSFTASTEVKNENTRSFQTTADNKHEFDLTIRAPEGKTCDAVINVKSCQLQANGRLRYTAEGWVWFNYKSQVNGHYKWAANIARAVKSIDDRSSFLEFRGSVQVNTYVDYNVTCARYA
ncbi:hypothetical protein VNI00_013413 [Paramarasmius palmivorus]|uniref:Uncharacterized protein n=1 Tax=Paramarasmius palmivorus TaxID=297713 RepID=A0AAW0BZK4_9AGAR